MTLENIVECFEINRREKGVPFDEDRFIDFLLSEPKRSKGIHNSFEGKRRFFRFWNQVQLSHGVCFSFKDREKNYSLKDFVARVEELKTNPKSSRAALRHQMKYGFEWNISIFMNIFLISLLLFSFNWPLIFLIALVLFAYANYKHISFHIKEKKYLHQLQEKLNQL